MNFKEVLIRLVAYTTPYVYDNNISLLELVRKLYKIVNELCKALQDLNADYEQFKEDVNAEIESFESDMTSDLQALRDYVDDYFNSLDIEQTVKDVLEEMTQDGTLERLLNETVLVNINNHLSELDGEITGLDSRIDDLESDNTTNKSNIGPLNNLNTTDKTSLVNAINEVDSNTDSNTTNIGNLSNLETTDKNNLVSAVNEIKDEASNIGTLNNLTTTDKTSLVNAINEVDSNTDNNTSDILANTNKIQDISDFINFVHFTQYTQASDFIGIVNNQNTTSGTINSPNLGIAYNKDYSVFKIYGRIYYTSNSLSGSRNIKIQTPMRPTEEITFNGAGFTKNENGSAIGDLNMRLATDGVLTIISQSEANGSFCARLYSSIYVAKNFGDVE